MSEMRMSEWEIPPAARNNWRQLEEILKSEPHTPLATVATYSYALYLTMNIMAKMKAYRLQERQQ